MTKEVKLSISGTQWGTDMDQDCIESKVEAEYYNRNGSHYLLYEEKVEGFAKPSKNRIKCKGKQVELIRQGVVNTQMIFEENKTHMTDYVTPYGKLVLGVNTKKVTVEEWEELIRILVEYQLEMEEEVVSRHKLEIRVRPAH